jgi:pilus assembly protein Flp/PilA
MYLYLYLKNWLAEQEEGQDLVEYALIIALVSIALVAALGVLATDIKTTFASIGTTLGS